MGEGVDYGLTSLDVLHHCRTEDTVMIFSDIDEDDGSDERDGEEGACSNLSSHWTAMTKDIEGLKSSHIAQEDSLRPVRVKLSNVRHRR